MNLKKVYVFEGELDEQFEQKLTKELGIIIRFASIVPTGHFAKVTFEPFRPREVRDNAGGN